LNNVAAIRNIYISFRWIERYVNEGGKAIDKPTTVAQLAVDSGVSVTDLIMGERSIGARLETEGFAALPSTTLPIQNSPKYSYFQVQNPQCGFSKIC
jgi:hypothetical protein